MLLNMSSKKNKKSPDELEMNSKRKHTFSNELIETNIENEVIHKSKRRKVALNENKVNTISYKNLQTPNGKQEPQLVKKTRKRNPRLKLNNEAAVVSNSTELKQEPIVPVVATLQNNVNPDSLENSQQNQVIVESKENQQISVNKRTSVVKKREEITWPVEDLTELIERMERIIPKNDSLAYSTRAEKLDWEKVIFKNYTASECKKTWHLVQKNIRRFRLLAEVLVDAKEFLNRPREKTNKSKTRHPDMPRRPLSSYILFYLQTKNQVLQDNPGLDATEISKKMGLMFKALPPEERAEYEKMATKLKEEYEEKLKKFLETHPDYPVIPRRERPPKLAKPPKPIKEQVPKKPQTPFGLFYQSEMKNEQNAVVDKNGFKEECKERWKQLSDNKKLQWITTAEEEQRNYEEAIKQYIANHPTFVPHLTKKPMLTKEEISIKDRVAGKPVKPPNSAYSLFSRNILQSDEIKKIPAKERLNFVSKQWNMCTEIEKNHYKEMCANLVEKYKQEFASYLETLPEEKRQLEMANNLPKRRKSISEENEMTSKKKKRRTERRDRPRSDRTRSSRSRAPAKLKFQEPEQPPRSTFKYFAKSYTGEAPVIQAWKALSMEDKNKYEQELVQKKRKYIAEFEKFLKSLSKEELQEYSTRKQEQKSQGDDEDDDDVDDDDEDEDNGSSGSSDSDMSEGEANAEGSGEESDS